jgi:hypothetical protein
MDRFHQELSKILDSVDTAVNAKNLKYLILKYSLGSDTSHGEAATGR